MQAPQVAAELRDVVPEKCSRKHLPFFETGGLLLYRTQPNQYIPAGWLANELRDSVSKNKLFHARPGQNPAWTKYIYIYTKSQINPIKRESEGKKSESGQRTPMVPFDGSTATCWAT